MSSSAGRTLSVMAAVLMLAGSLHTAFPDDRPTHETPRALAIAWLSYHEADLCQGIDSVFAFGEEGLEIWSLVEDERSYDRFRGILNALRDSHRIVLHETRLPPERVKVGDLDVPPSLWENYELRLYLGDPVARVQILEDSEDRSRADSGKPDEFLKHRLYMFAEQTLDWNRKMKRYSSDLPALVQVALDVSLAPDLRSRAGAVGRNHLQNMNRYIEKIEKNLSAAIPGSERTMRTPGSSDKHTAAKASVESATLISSAAEKLARRIFNFIYPEQYTVDLDELRQSSLLESLRELKTMNADLQKALAHLPRRIS